MKDMFKNLDAISRMAKEYQRMLRQFEEPLLQASRMAEESVRPMLDAAKTYEEIGGRLGAQINAPALSLAADHAVLAEKLAPATDFVEALAPQIRAATALSEAVQSSRVFDQLKGLPDLGGQWRALFEQYDALRNAVPREAFASLNAVADAVRHAMPGFPSFDPVIFGPAWNEDLAAAVSRVRERAEAIANDPEAGVEDVEAFVADTAAVVAAAEEPARPGMRAWARIVAYWILGNIAWDLTKEVVPNALVTLILVLTTVARPPAPLSDLPPRPAPPLGTETGVLEMPDGWQIESLPAIIRRAGPKAAALTLEFFTVEISNRNTRAAYAHAVILFMNWCDDRGLELADITPFVVAAYVEQMQREYAAPTVKQHLAAIRMLFDYLVLGRVLPMNPAASVRGPKHIVRKGKTDVLQPEEARLLLDSIDVSKPAGLRDRALLALMIYSFARVSAVIAMDVKDYYPQGKRWWVRLHEKGGRYHHVPVHHKAKQYLDAYLAAAGIGAEAGSPLWRTLTRERRLSSRRISRVDVFRMIRRRVRDAKLGTGANCHTFRATGITAYLLNGGTLERAQAIAGHESPRTTKLYDKTADEITAADIERIGI